jgi:hypothetical protein
MTRNWKYQIFCLLGGLVLAIYLGHWLLPASNPVEPLVPRNGWISTRVPSKRGHFRQTLHIPFLPEYAWIAVSADDYQLFVNGFKVGTNMHLTDAGNAFQDRLSDVAQRLSRGLTFRMVRDPLLRQNASEEWRGAQFYDIREFLLPGRNTIAIYVQSDRSVRLAVTGLVSAGRETVDISGDASAWRASAESTVQRGVSWHDPLYDDVDWEEAAPAEAPTEKPVFAALDPAVWTQPFDAQPVTAPDAGDEVMFRTLLPPELPGRTGWVRVRGNWHYDVFVGDAWVGGGEGPSHLTALDISQYLHNAPVQLSVRLHQTYRDELELPDNPRSSNSTRQVPWLAVDGKIEGEPISTGRGWSYLASFHPDWLRGHGEWYPAKSHEVSRISTAVHLRPARSRDRRWFGVFARLLGVLASLLALGIWLLSRLIPGSHLPNSARRVEFACWLLAPALFGILLLEALRFRFGECDTILYFLDPANNWLLGLLGPVLLLGSLLLLFKPGWRDRARVDRMTAGLGRMPTWLWLTLICLLGLGLRAYALDFQPPQADENVSWDAARGIMRTGGPLAVSGVLYTRSPLYHYLLAGWLALFGDSLVSGRAFSLLAGIGVIPVAYALVHELTRRRYLGLLTALILAVDPWQLGTVNFIRFYQQMQFFAILSLLFFLKGFVWQQGKKYQNLFFLCATAGVLSQEIFLCFFPAFLLAGILCYRPFSWTADRNIWLGFLTLMVVSLLDVYSWAVLCLTPHVAVATTSASQVQLHFINGSKSVLPGFASIFFWNTNGSNFLFSALFFAGFVYWLRHPNQAVLTVYGVALLSLAALTVLVVPMAGRYCFAIYPMLVIGAVISGDAMIRHAAAWFAPVVDGTAIALGRRWALLMGGLLVLAWGFNNEFDKVLGSYERDRFIEHHQAVAYIQEHRLHGDKLMTVHPQAGAILAGGVDYFIQGVVHFDELYMTPHGIVDRWGGGRLVWKLEQFQNVFQHNDRVWIVVDGVRLASMSPDIADYLFRCCTVEREFFGAQVLLWDKSAGRFSAFPDKGGQADSY